MHARPVNENEIALSSPRIKFSISMDNRGWKPEGSTPEGDYMFYNIMKMAESSHVGKYDFWCNLLFDLKNHINTPTKNQIFRKAVDREVLNWPARGICHFMSQARWKRGLEQICYYWHRISRHHRFLKLTRWSINLSKVSMKLGRDWWTTLPDSSLGRKRTHHDSR